jgi:hypothetical protein
MFGKKWFFIESIKGIEPTKNEKIRFAISEKEQIIAFCKRINNKSAFFSKYKKQNSYVPDILL